MVRALARAAPQRRHEGQRARKSVQDKFSNEIPVVKKFYPENVAIG
jgi:hypothetical protein